MTSAQEKQKDHNKYYCFYSSDKILAYVNLTLYFRSKISIKRFVIWRISSGWTKRAIRYAFHKIACSNDYCQLYFSLEGECNHILYLNILETLKNKLPLKNSLSYLCLYPKLRNSHLSNKVVP